MGGVNVDRVYLYVLMNIFIFKNNFEKTYKKKLELILQYSQGGFKPAYICCVPLPKKNVRFEVPARDHCDVSARPNRSRVWEGRQRLG